MARLLVLVPGIRSKPADFDPLLARLKKDSAWREDTVVAPWDHGTTLFGRKHLLQVANNLALFIKAQWAVKNGFDDVVLVGHSMGALLVRQAYLIGLGSAVNKMDSMAWASRVSRIVLLSGLNRGVTLRWWEKLLLPLVVSRHGSLRDLLEGSDFITNLRIWWMRKLERMEKRPVVVQILGGLDERVQKEDSLDIERFDDGHQQQIENVGHKDVYIPDKNGQFRPLQYEILSLAILKPMEDDVSAKVNMDASKKVYFLVHGIRDSNDDWVAAMKTLLEERIPGCVPIEPSIGRFSALQFLLPFERRRYVRWFQNVYSQKLAQYPLASLNFVGHSYGTYLLGYGLRHLSGMTFDRVYLGGSVLPAEWDWDDHRSQVQEVRNACGAHDVPVGLLCSALRGLQMTDIGTAGYTGFRVPFHAKSEIHYYQGGHGAAVSKAARGDIVGFLRDGLEHECSTLVTGDSNFARLSAGVKLLLPLVLVLYLLLIVASFFYPPLHAATKWLLIALAGFLALVLGITAFI